MHHTERLAMVRWAVLQINPGKSQQRKSAHPLCSYLQSSVSKRYVNSSREKQNSHIKNGCKLKVERWIAEGVNQR